MLALSYTTEMRGSVSCTTGSGPEALRTSVVDQGEKGGPGFRKVTRTAPESAVTR